MNVPNPINIRNRIERYTNDIDLQMLLKAIYLLGVWGWSEILGKKYDSDFETHVYGPTGDDVWPKPVCVNNKRIKTVFFRIKTAKKKGKTERTILLPKDREPWAEELYSYFKEKGSEKVFPFDRVNARMRVINSGVFRGLEEPSSKRGKIKHYKVGNLRFVRIKELEEEHGFGEAHLETYGIINLTRTRASRKSLSNLERKKLEKEYLWKLCKYPEQKTTTKSNSTNNKEIIIAGCKPYDAFRLIENILLSAKKRIYIIDPYVDERTFSLYLEDLIDSVEIRLLSKNLWGKSKIIAKKFEKQHINFELRINDEIHDRYIIVDNRAWIFGQSLMDAGNKTMSIIELSKPNVIEKIFNDLWNRSKKLSQ